MKYKLSVKSLDDIEGIWVYTFKNWSEKQADRYLNLILAEIEFLSENPESGKDFRKIRKDYRCSKVKSHLIFFRLLEHKNEIEVIRILHQQMDIENRLDK